MKSCGGFGTFVGLDPKIVYFKDRAFRKRLMDAPDTPELDLEGRGGREQQVEILPEEKEEGAGKSTKTSRKKRRTKIGSTCARAIDDYQAATGNGTSSPVFELLMGEFGRFAIVESGVA